MTREPRRHGRSEGNRTGKPAAARKGRDRRGRLAGEPDGVVEVPVDEPEEAPIDPGIDAEQARRDADAMVGDEAPGGTVSVPDHDSVDEWAQALGVERSPESPVRSSAELLDERDRRRGSRRPPPTL